ncbi:MAG: 1-acyl-sn-glycerol-3-phosphate acyltransferase [Candidatus Lightella neohaematopini]|nr:1-acyl-sn-glycerol-3-phosphate acyltransferase [Candidatus Lightella neohaematopini]
MFFWKNIFFLCISFICKKVLNIRTYHNNLINVSNKINNPLMYLVLTNSKFYLVLLYIQCKKYNLPNPLDNVSINNKKIPRYFCIKEKHNYFRHMYFNKNINKFNNYLNIIVNYCNNITIILVTIISNKKKLFFYKNSYFFINNIINLFIRIINFLWIKKDSIIYFSKPLSSFYIYNKINNITLDNTNKILRIISIYFIRQKIIIIGSNNFNMYDINNIISNIRQYVRVSKINKLTFNKENIIKIFKEISDNFSYEAFNLCNNLLQFFFKKINHIIKVYNIHRVRIIAEKRHKIIYIPCHRSHMDYIIISYILYNNILLPPLIAAGINLNFWLLGNIARLLGAFFIRRGFRNNKLYSIVFREYLNYLLNNDNTIEYFIEGGRSRTGKLLVPKTGLLNIIIKYVLNNVHRQVTIIPIHISYTKIIEIDYYNAEINNNINKKGYTFFLFEQIKNIYNVKDAIYVNFGQPININKIIKKTYYLKTNKKYITTLVNSVAYNIMSKINNAVVINISSLCLTILLDSNNYTLKRTQLFKQLLCYLNLLKRVSYSSDLIIRNFNNKKYWLKNFLSNNKNIIYNRNTYSVSLIKDNIYNIKYYKNSIQHTLILPALIANIVYTNHNIKRTKLIDLVDYIYPIVKLDFFINHTLELKFIINKIINEFIRQHLLLDNNNKLFLTKHYEVIRLLAKSINKVLLRYIIICILLINNIELKFISLINNWDIIQNKLNIIQDIYYIFDNMSFNNIVLIFRSKFYCKNNNINIIKINKLYNIFKKLIIY